MHGTEDVLFRGLTQWVLLVIREDHHVLSPISEMLNQVGRHIAHIIDTPSQLTTLTEVVDADQETFPPTRTVGVAESIALGGSLSEMLRP